MKVELFFNGVEYFKVNSLSASHNISMGVALKVVDIRGIINGSMIDFTKVLATEGVMLASLFIDDKLYMEAFITQKQLSYKENGANGFDILIRLKDRFWSFIKSDVINTKPKGTLKNFISTMLTEMTYNKPLFPYVKSIKTTADLVTYGPGVTEQKLKTFKENTLQGSKVLDILGKALSMHNLILISNGYDELRLENPSLAALPSFSISRKKGEQTLIKYAEKVGDKANDIAPSRVIILNTRIEGSGKDKIKDNDRAVGVNYSDGHPHYQRLNKVSFEGTYQDIKRSLNYNLTGIRARSNSFLYKIANKLLDDNKSFIRPNQVITVYDEKTGIDENMYILQSGFTIAATSGLELVLNLTTKDAFTNNTNIKQRKSLMRK